MNIKNRLEKLENASNVNSENCACPGGLQTRVIAPDLDRTEEEYQLLLAEAQRPETCERCGKLIERRIIIVEVVKNEVSGARLQGTIDSLGANATFKL